MPHVQNVSIVLSGFPSQSLSADEEQSRAVAYTAFRHGPQASLAQVCVPCLQIPCAICGPQICVAPVTQGQASFAVPLQFASSPCTAQLSLVCFVMLHAPH
jgi:hypothetical protein